MEESFNEAVGEYTLLNINKALRVGNYTIENVNTLAKKYATGKVFKENTAPVPNKPITTTVSGGSSGTGDLGKELSQELSKMDTNSGSSSSTSSNTNIKFESALNWRERLARYTGKA
jgi:hypothetical protein